MATIDKYEEVSEPVRDGWVLYFQRCKWNLDDGTTENGYRFIYRRPDGTLQAARGQARIPDAATLQRLIDKARGAGWYQ